MILSALFLLIGCGPQKRKESATNNTPTGQTPVTKENFVVAETHRHFKEFTAKGAVDKFIHDDDLFFDLEKQTMIRPNIDMFRSFAIVDISKGATITLPDIGSRFRVVQIIDANGYTSDVLYHAGTYDLKSNSGAEWVCVFMRTVADPDNSSDLDLAHKLMKSTTVTSKGHRSFLSKYNFNDAEVVEMRNKIVAEGREKYKDSFGAFGDIEDIKDYDKFVYGAAAGWGGLPEKEVVYWTISPQLGDACAELTIQAPPVEKYWSVTVYDSLGWLANKYPLRNSNNTTPNADGSLTFHFGCGDEALNNIPITNNWSLVVRFFGPKDDVLDGKYKVVMPTLVK